MSLWIPINVWTIGAVLTVAAMVWAARQRSEGIFDFWPAFVGLTAVVGIGAFWLAVLLVKVLG